MFVAYMLVITLQSGAGELVDPRLHYSIDTCLTELGRMNVSVQHELAVYNIIASKGSCRTDIVDQVSQPERNTNQLQKQSTKTQGHSGLQASKPGSG